jgi:hypothetical protein
MQTPTIGKTSFSWSRAVWREITSGTPEKWHIAEKTATV